jgi:hypothetical protein
MSLKTYQQGLGLVYGSTSQVSVLPHFKIFHYGTGMCNCVFGAIVGVHVYYFRNNTSEACTRLWYRAFYFFNFF